MFPKVFPNRRGSSLAAAALAAAAVFAASTVWASTVVDIQFAGASAYKGSFSGNQGAYTGDGLTNPTWNVLSPASTATSGSLSNLVTSADGPTSEGVAFTDNGTYAGTFGSGTNALLSGYIYTNSSPYSSVVTLTGLTDGGAYQLYLYGQNAGFGGYVGATFSITTGSGTSAAGSNTYTAGTSSSSQVTFVENTNYVIFNATADNTGTLAITYTPNPTYTSQDAFNGLQLISVPEPASLGLVGIGGLGLLLIKRRKTV